MIPERDYKSEKCFLVSGVEIDLLIKMDRVGVLPEDAYVVGRDSDGVEMWRYRPTDDSSKKVGIYGVESTPDKTHVFIWQSNNLRIRLDPKTGEILESTYQMT